ncbi:transposase [Nostoc sp.]|uniref:transposase n=1 Tax=Nostoc sp. TaxID=1180 RepID=UPI002FF86245
MFSESDRRGIKLKKTREAKGLSQNELARKTGYSLQNIQKIEQRRAASINTSRLSPKSGIVNCYSLTRDRKIKCNEEEFSFTSPVIESSEVFSFIDSTPINVYHNCRAHSHKVFKGLVKWGKNSPSLALWFQTSFDY